MLNEAFGKTRFPAYHCDIWLPLRKNNLWKRSSRKYSRIIITGIKYILYFMLKLLFVP